MRVRSAPLLPLAVPLVLAAACVGGPRPAPGAESAADARPEAALVLRDGFARSGDGVEIHYLEGGSGEPALVFLHGWLGDAEWWRPTMERFASSHRVVALDLAGHGRSGRERVEWTVERFASDVACVVRALDLRRVVLVGHSMSGTIAVKAALDLGARVELVVPVDSLQDADWDLPEDTWRQFFGGLRADFPAAVDGFFRGMLFRPDSPPEVVERVVAQARAADPAVAVPMLERAREFDLRAALRSLRAPIHAIQSDMNPTNLETNRRYAPRFDVEQLAGVGHWPMLEDPAAFERALGWVVALPR